MIELKKNFFMFNTILRPYLKIDGSLMTYIHILKPYLTNLIEIEIS